MKAYSMDLRQRVYPNLELESIRRTAELARSDGEVFDTPAFVAGALF